MKECLVRSMGACILGLLLADEAALLRPTAGAGVTVIAMDVLTIGVTVSVAAGAVGGAIEVTEVTGLVDASCVVEGKGDGRFISLAVASAIKDN
jgi:hypothetical protein